MNEKHYQVEGSRVLYHRNPIKGADASSFSELHTGWAKDDKHVYIYGRVRRDLDAKSFKLLNALFGRDNQHVCYLEGKVPEASVSSFEVLDQGWFEGDFGPQFEGYGRDKNNVFYYARSIGKPKIVKGAIAASFRLLGFQYATDGEHVFHGGCMIKKADPNSFKILTKRYSRDQDQVFFCETLIQDADVTTFQVVDELRNRARDIQSLFECHKRVEKYFEPNEAGLG